MLGVRDGFTLIGETGKLIVVVHYDFARRTCRIIPIDEGSSACRLAPIRSNHAIVIVRGLWMIGAVLLGKGTFSPTKDPERRYVAGRSLRPFRESTDSSRLGTYRVDRRTGTVELVASESTSHSWRRFTPGTYGKPTYAGLRTVEAIELAGTTAAIESRGTAPHGEQWTIDFFRGPDGDFIRQVPILFSTTRPQFQLSPDGKLVAFSLGQQVEVQAVDDPRRLLLASSGAGRQTPGLFFVGPQGFVVSSGRKGYSWHLVDWSGPLTVHTETRKTATFISGFKNPAFERFIAARPLPATKARVVAPTSEIVAVCVGRIGKMQVFLDRAGQVTILNWKGDLVFLFHARGESWTAWMPDGTRFGRGNVHLWQNAPNAAVKMGAALRAAQGGGA